MNTALPSRLAAIHAHKNKPHAFACLTAYTTPMAQSLAPHVDLLLVGDSVGTVLYGMDNTTGVTMDMMVNHARAVMRADPVCPVIVDMPYGSYESGAEEALRSAKRLMDESGADGVKLEGGVSMAAQISAITGAGIPVMGHIGLQPQSVVIEGGYKIKGKDDAGLEALHADLHAVEDAGAFAFVIEGTIASAADTITKAAKIPSIGIGASAACDGQILVTDDMIGALHGHIPKFVKEYADVKGVISDAAAAYAADVRVRKFPSDAFTYKKKP